jgi:FMN phosphatase YigB (HAD superfamily)
MVCSTVLGVHKLDLTMYYNAVQQAHLTLGESAFFDHTTLELVGARLAGIMTVAVDYDPDAKADYYCQSLLDLLNV